MSTRKLLEIACFDTGSAKIAQDAGADRIELCEDYTAGGITPSFAMIREARKIIQIPLHVIVRPRGGNFVYSGTEITDMKNSISFCKEQECEGIVFGALTEQHEIDLPLCKELIALAGPLSLTFHRAIDQCVDINKAIKQLIDLRVHRVLTSGGADSALQGAGTLKKLQELFGKDIVIMPGGGIRSSNISEVMRTGCDEYHSAAITSQTPTADAEEIKKIRQLFQPGS